jgi:hypothetical protein
MHYITGERVVDAESTYSSQRSWDATDLLIDIHKRKGMNEMLVEVLSTWMCDRLLRSDRSLYTSYVVDA